jgi:hypothetical protein
MRQPGSLASEQAYCLGVASASRVQVKCKSTRPRGEFAFGSGQLAAAANTCHLVLYHVASSRSVAFSLLPLPTRVTCPEGHLVSYHVGVTWGSHSGSNLDRNRTSTDGSGCHPTQRSSTVGSGRHPTYRSHDRSHGKRASRWNVFARLSHSSSETRSHLL